jgi:hypothetical protein
MNNYWQVINQFVKIESPWLTLIGEKVKDNQGKILDYWRVEKADSLIIITEYQKQLIFPKLTYRVGIAKVTLDFAGGRVNAETTLENNALSILKKELNLEKKDLQVLTQINREGWAINSAFNNQKLWGFYAKIKPETNLNADFIGATYSLTKENLKCLLKDLTCLQCRTILLESICQEFVATS